MSKPRHICFHTAVSTLRHISIPPLPPSAFVFYHPHQQLVEVAGCACSHCSQGFLPPSVSSEDHELFDTTRLRVLVQQQLRAEKQRQERKLGEATTISDSRTQINIPDCLTVLPHSDCALIHFIL